MARHEKASDAVAADVLESMSQWCMKYIAAFDDRYVQMYCVYSLGVCLGCAVASHHIPARLAAVPFAFTNAIDSHAAHHLSK